MAAMMADSGLSFDHPGPSNGVVPIFNTKSHFFRQTVPLSHIMRLTPMQRADVNENSYTDLLC